MIKYSWKPIQCILQISKSHRIMGRILSKINEIQEGGDSCNSLCRHTPNKAAKEDLCYVFSFSTQYLRHGKNTIFELLKTISRWKCSNLMVKFLGSENYLALINQMLKNSLVQLVQNIRCDWSMNVTEWEAIPEWLIDIASNIFWHAIWMKLLRTAICLLPSLLNGLFSPLASSIFCWCQVLEVISRSLALNTCTIFCAGDKALFWVVSNVAGKNGMNTSNSTIITGHLNTIGASFNERLQDNAHWLVEQYKGSMLLVIYPRTIHLLDRKVGNEDTCMFWRFSASGFGNSQW